MKTIISKITNSHQKAEIVKEVLLDLPEWFGLPDSTQAYIDESRDVVLFAAFVEDAVVGFITLKPTSDATAEVHAMGVKKNFHRKGIGQKLILAFEDYAKADFQYIQVKTVDEGYYETYDQTIAFYKQMGFVKLEVFPDLWDEWNPCLILVKKIKK